MTRFRTIGLLAIIALALGVVAAVPASASPSIGPNSFAGYTVPPGVGTAHTVTGTVTVPTVTCPPGATGNDGLDMAVSWFKSDGSSVIHADVLVRCAPSAPPAYSMVAVVGASQKSSPVTPGDAVTLQATYSSTTTATIARDATTGITIRANSQPRHPTPSYAQVGIQSLAGHAFAHTPVQLRALALDGAALGSLDPTSHDQLDTSNRTILAAGPLAARIFYVRFVGKV